MMITRLLLSTLVVALAHGPAPHAAPHAAAAQTDPPAWGAAPDGPLPRPCAREAPPEPEPCGSPPKPPPGAEPDQDAAEKAEPQTAEEILQWLEHRAGDLRAFTADLQYEAWDELLGRREIRTGSIIYRVDPVTRDRSFAVLFETLIVGQRRQDRPRHYIFADRFLVEVDHDSKQFIKRELVPPGRQIDPLRLGEGPIPLPIGQPKDEVVARFEVTRIDIPDEGLLARLHDVHGLRLVPRIGTTEADDYERVDLFYHQVTGLPVGILALEPGGNRKTVRLENLRHNPDLGDEELEHLSIDEPDPAEWSIDVQPWRSR